MKRSHAIALFGIIGALILVYNTFFIVPQTAQAVVLQFGAFVRTVTEPGLQMKVPFVQDVALYEKRLLDLDPPETQILLTDQIIVIVDAYARYRITDPFRFFTSARNEDGLNVRLGPTISNKIRNELAKVTLSELLSDRREKIMNDILESVRADAGNFGIEVVDIRIGRSELPPEVSQSTYARMRADREQRAKQARAEGAQKATKIRAEADNERTILLAQANKEAEILRGEGDASRTRIIGEAYGRDPKFAEFYRAMQAYRESLAQGDTTMVLSPNSEFFRYFQNGVQ